ncbi:hypothetical protein KF728_17225 [Candidatus Obscuribacterales bacterium]|nr:hypothetical protein [Candidatus Obscuribacterales bacterium]
MNEITQINGRIKLAVQVTERAAVVIANAQSDKWPYSSLNHSTRIFCAILAAQARELAERATKQVGVELKDAGSEGLQATVEEFLARSAGLVFTNFEAMATARIASQNALTTMALDLVARAERVLEGDEDLNGREIVHGELYYK